MPPLGFVLWFFSPRTPEITRASLAGFLLLACAVAVNLLASALLAVCPFFFEPTVHLINQVLRLTVILVWAWAVWSLWLHGKGAPVPRWFERLSEWKRGSLFFEPISARFGAKATKP